MTYGDIRMRLVQAAPGVSLDLIDGWIIDRYQSILDKLPWQRLENETVIETAAEYSTGTLTVTNGSAVIAGVGTTWTGAMTGRIIRPFGQPITIPETDSPGGPTYYEFTYSAAGTASLDRPYEDASAAGVAYRINQNVYPLPDGTRLVRGITDARNSRLLTRTTLAQLNESAPERAAYGNPQFWALYIDQASNPPVLQVELYPVPVNGYGLFADTVLDGDANVTAGATSASLLPWLRPACLNAGVMADISAHLKDWNSEKSYAAKYAIYLADMVRNEAQRIGPKKIQIADRFARHRARRWSR
jgi:hypothetical protein